VYLLIGQRCNLFLLNTGKDGGCSGIVTDITEIDSNSQGLAQNSIDVADAFCAECRSGLCATEETVAESLNDMRPKVG